MALGGGSASGPTEIAQDLLGVVGLPGLGRPGGRVFLVQADEQVDQLTADGLDSQQRGQLGEADQPVRIPAGPILVSPIHDPEDPMVGLSRLMEKAADLLRCGAHLFPPVRPPGWQYRAVPALARSTVPASNDSDTARAPRPPGPRSFPPPYSPAPTRPRPPQSRL